MTENIELYRLRQAKKENKLSRKGLEKLKTFEEEILSQQKRIEEISNVGKEKTQQQIKMAEEKISEIKKFLDKVGKGVQGFTYKITYCDGKYWTYDIEGTSIDGEEQYYRDDANTLDELFVKIKKDIGYD